MRRLIKQNVTVSSHNGLLIHWQGVVSLCRLPSRMALSIWQSACRRDVESQDLTLRFPCRVLRSVA